MLTLLLAGPPSAGMAQDGPERFIDTVAGTGTAGYNGDNIPATDAQLTIPDGAALDLADGSLYIADVGNGRVRRVDPGTGLITTVAGTGTNGYNGDGIPATSAQLSSARGVAVAPDGALYIGDTSNHRVRRVEPGTGLITTIAGTGTNGYNGDGIPATSAQLYAPHDVAVGPGGAVFIAERFNNRVRRVDPGTGLITTVAGTGTAGYNGDHIPADSAQVNQPLGVAVGADGAVYVADSFNHRVRRVDPDSGLIETVAGTGTAGYNGDGIDAITAQLNVPQRVAVRPDGALYIADTYNHRLRLVDPDTLLISTVAGTGASGYNGDEMPAITAQLSYPTSPELDTDGTLLVADDNNHRVRAVSPVPMPEDTRTTSGVPVTIDAPDGTVFTDVDDADPGSASLAGDGSSITYTPPPNFDGDVPVAYTIRTTARWSVTATGTVTVHVTSPPAPTINRPQQDQTLSNPNPRFSGAAEPGSEVVVRDQDGRRLCATIASDEGRWSCRATRALADGTYRVTATSSDQFGNTGTSNQRQFVISANGNGSDGGRGGRGQHQLQLPRHHRTALARTGGGWTATIATALMLLSGSTTLLAATRTAANNRVSSRGGR